MNVVCCQLDIVWEDKAANHRKVRELLDASPPPPGSLVVLPEMFATGFSMNVANVSDSGAGQTRDFLARAASDYRVYLLGGLVQTAPDGRGRNECVVFSPDGVEVARYCKLHPFTYAGESRHYASGEDVRLFACQEFTVAPFICYDLRFPEIFRAAVVRGAELIVVIANWPAPRRHHWLTLLKARAIENQAYVAGVNRCGNDPKLSYSGDTTIVGPRGEVVASAGEREGLVSAEIDLEALRSYRREFPFLADIHAEYVTAAGESHPRQRAGAAVETRFGGGKPPVLEGRKDVEPDADARASGRETPGVGPAVDKEASGAESFVARSLVPFGTTIFSEMTALANQLGAINLAQGFPDFEGPEGVVEAAADALRSGANQYSRSMGHPVLVNAVAEHQRRFYGLEYDPLTEVTVFCGATEGIASSILGLLNPGDEIILFEPFYDSYPACTALAGAVPRFVTLRPPDFSLDPQEFEAAFSPRTRLLLLNTPHNPTGKVFSREELELIARLCQERDVVAVTDEVYEHLTYGAARHVPLASIPGMRDRTLTLSSTGKTFSLTGWKVGWATGPAKLISAAQAAHQYITFCPATPLQVAVGHALRTHTDRYLEDLKREYTERRDFLLEALSGCGFRTIEPQGAYFIVADYSSLGDAEDRRFAREMVEGWKVAAVPMSVFCHKGSPNGDRRLLRFAFCKRMETLRAAAERLGAARRGSRSQT